MYIPNILNTHEQKYEKVLVDQDQKEAIEMVRKTRQMGVPVTAVLYEGGEEVILI